jgi:hypothetical protein
LEYPELVKRVIQLVLLSSLVAIAKDDGFITATDSEKEPVKVEGEKEEPKEEKKEDEGPAKPTKEELEEFYKTIDRYFIIDPKKEELAKLILMWDLKGADFDQDTYDEDTKWLDIFKREMQIAEDNLDIGAYIFFFQEHVHLVIKRAGMSVKKK